MQLKFVIEKDVTKMIWKGGKEEKGSPLNMTTGRQTTDSCRNFTELHKTSYGNK